MALGARPNFFFTQSAHLCAIPYVACDVKQPISLTHKGFSANDKQQTITFVSAEAFVNKRWISCNLYCIIELFAWLRLRGRKFAKKECLSYFNVLTQDQNSTLNCDPDPGSQFIMESWLGSQFNLELRLWVIIQIWTKRRRCIYMWSWTEMLTASYRPRARTVWIPHRKSIEICQLGEGHSLCPWECRLSVEKPFPRQGIFHFVFCRFRRAPGRSTGPMQMKSSMTSIRVIYVHRERERKLILKATK